uniref:Retrotransposon domain containing protein n=1 Tax=Haemonchus contortus TaxID=6289 RepID=W6NHN5_HAECO
MSYSIRNCRIGELGFSIWLSQGAKTADTVAIAERDDNLAVERLWSLDSLGIVDDHHPSADAKLQERIIQDFDNSACLVDGVLYVCFPWKTDHPPLDDNKQLAYCRLSSQFHRLSQNPSVWQQYVKAIEDHVAAGFVEEVDEFSFDDPRVYYIPHQAVYKESSATTKLRVVFDASSKRKGAHSLNDCLHQGPALLPDLVGILLRARLHRFLLIADVEKAFHQVRLQRTQRDATRFLWLKDPYKPPSPGNMRILRFTRIPFGVNASPFLLAAAIRFYLRSEASPLSDKISRNTYVDNVILGADSRGDVLSKYNSLKSIFGRMHMNLREFLCNSSAVNPSIAPQDRAVNPSKASLLGIRWLYESDTLAITIKAAQFNVTTKRLALRALASTFDPLGLLTPFLSPVKVFIQDLWLKELSWDTPLDKSQLQQWRQLLADLKHPLPLIPRLVLPSGSKPSSLELCVFGDASQRLYACCAYLVCRTPDVVHSRLLMAKSHLNTPKPVTIPRLELLAALVSIRMTQFLVKHLNLPFTAIHLFSDSLIALHWIHARKTFKVFVQNRVEAIRRIVAEIEDQNIPVQSHYVASEENPADCATRGLATKEAENHIWWTGPHFLRSPSSQWPNAHINFQIPPTEGEDLEEQHPQAFTVQEGEFRSVLPFYRTNKYSKLLRIVAYVLKFLRRYIFDRVPKGMRDNIFQKLPCVAVASSSSAFEASDIYAAERQLILAHYREGEKTLQRLQLDRYNAKRAQDHLIRCPSRVGSLHTAPILLLPEHRLTYLIILHYHIAKHHAGVVYTVANLRLKFFIPSVRTHVHRTLRGCVVCKKISGHAYRYPNMPQLPPERVKRSWPFQNIGVDYLGPLTVSNAVVGSNKVWICLFTCMATRAVHLEVVLDNSTQEFLLAFLFESAQPFRNIQST